MHHRPPSSLISHRPNPHRHAAPRTRRPSPASGDGTFTAYTMPSISDRDGWGCSGQRLCDSFRGMWVYRTRWALPANATCDHCKLQWVRAAPRCAAFARPLPPPLLAPACFGLRGFAMHAGWPLVLQLFLGDGLPAR
jgi:hypothetical protein